LKGNIRGFDGIVIKDKGREELRKAARVSEMVANLDRVLEEHGRSLCPRLAK